VGPRDALEPDAKNDAPHRDQQNVVWDAESVVPSFDFHVVSPHIPGMKLFSYQLCALIHLSLKISKNQ
jgi:hypothetical protein